MGADSKKEGGGSRAILYNWSQTTSSHGLPHIGRAQSAALRIFWSVIFVTALCLLVWQVYLLIEKFQRYDKVTKMELRFMERPFPAVTVCNLNPFQDTAVKAAAASGTGTLKASAEAITDLITEYDKKATALGQGDTYDAPAIYRFDGIEDTVALETRAKEDMLFLAAAMDPDDAEKLSYKMDENFIVSCSFNTRDCDNNTDFKLNVDAKYGNCYTFNHHYDPENPEFADNFGYKYLSNRAGPLFGLRMIVKTEIDEYLLTSESSGVRVVVHNQTENPFPDTFGYNAASGYATSLGISYRQIERLGPPHGECKNEQGNYTMEKCFRDCMQQQLIANCSCGDPRYMTSEFAHLPTCVLTNETAMGCYDDFSGVEAGTSRVTDCTCAQPCQQGVYDVTVSTARWPSGAFAVPGCYNTTDYCTTYYRENALMIEVYFEQLNFKELVESEAYTIVNLISDFGGQAGLWLGVSVVTGVEVIVLGVQLCMGKMKGGKQS